MFGPNDENDNESQEDTELDTDQSSLTEADFDSLRGTDDNTEGDDH